MLFAFICRPSPVPRAKSENRPNQKPGNPHFRINKNGVSSPSINGAGPSSNGVKPPSNDPFASLRHPLVGGQQQNRGQAGASENGGPSVNRGPSNAPAVHNGGQRNGSASQSRGRMGIQTGVRTNGLAGQNGGHSNVPPGQNGGHGNRRPGQNDGHRSGLATQNGVHGNGMAAAGEKRGQGNGQPGGVDGEDGMNGAAGTAVVLRRERDDPNRRLRRGSLKSRSVIILMFMTKTIIS